MRFYRLAAFAAVACVAGDASALQFRPIVVSGRPSGDPLGPELGVANDFSVIEFAVLSESGSVGLQAQLTQEDGVTSLSDDAIWRWSAGSKTLLAREGSQAAAFPAGVTHGSFPASIEIQIDDEGAVFFRDTLGGTAVSTNNRAWTVIDAAGVATAVAREGDVAPGTVVQYSDSIIVGDSNPGLSNVGNVLYRALLLGPGVTPDNNDAIMYGSPNSPSILLREGEPAPFFSPTAVVGETGQLGLFAAGDKVSTITGVIEAGEFQSVVLAGTPGSLVAVARSGEPAPGTLSSYQSFVGNVINSAGDVAFTSSVGEAVDRYLYLSNGAVNPIAGPGVAAPGTGTTFVGPGAGSTNPYPVALTDSGDLAFYAELAGGGEGIWTHSQGSTTAAFLSGVEAPGLPGVTIGDIEHWAYNDAGDLLVVSKLEGAVALGVNDVAAWWISPNGETLELLRTGDSLLVDPTMMSDERFIATIDLAGIALTDNGTVRNLTLNDTRTAILQVGFTDGSEGVFSVTVPEPSALYIACMLGLTIVLPTSRR